MELGARPSFLYVLLICYFNTVVKVQKISPKIAINPGGSRKLEQKQ